MSHSPEAASRDRKLGYNALAERTMNHASSSTVGLLLSGGLDSAILLGRLLDLGHSVQPFYVQTGMHWEAAERRSAEAFLQSLASAQLRPLVVFSQNVAEVYGNHWSLTGQSVPDETTDDAAVYLPGRNLLLVLQPALWCQLRGIRELHLAVLQSNPFPDATEKFFASLERTLELATGESLRVVRPFERLPKSQVMRFGEHLPLELSFSCIDPRADLHCGVCNKCAERKAAFAAAGLVDRTRYDDELVGGEASGATHG